MKRPPETAQEQAGPDVFALLEKRVTIEQWLDRLDSQRGSVSEKILERVRADYEKRLAETLEALGSHRSTVEDQLLTASDRLSIAEVRRADAEEQLEEGRLRNIIGELSDEEWSRERTSLEDAVGAAAEEENGVRGEVVRLTQLMNQLNQNEGDGLSHHTEVTESAFMTEISEDPSPIDDEPEIFSSAAEVLEQATAPEALPAVDEDDPFLASIDRLLTNGGEDARAIPLDDEEALEDTAPKPGLKCGECGYTNDLSAWFCGVCGADVG